VYRPIWFTSVMATGIVALAVREERVSALAWVLAALAAATYVALLIAHVRWWRLPNSRGQAIELFAFVAATEVLASLSHWHYVSLALWAVGAVAWLPVVALVLATRDGHVTGSWLLAAVATDSLAVTGAPLARHAGSDTGVALAVAAWLLALSVYCLLAAAILRRIARRDIRREDLDGDHWVTMGALAISALAGSRVLAAMTVLGWDLREAVRTVAIVVWIGALAWLPALIAAEAWRLRRPPLFTTGRWSTVFPLGMLAVASHALALTAGIAAAMPAFHVFTAVAVAAYAGMSAGSVSWARKNSTIGFTYSSSRGQRSPWRPRMSSARRVSKRTGWFR
jgi:tellurite resistance protein TehA-like permease